MSNSSVMFSESFWRFIKEEVGISRIYPVSSPNTKQKNKKVLSLAERQDRIDQMLRKVEFDDDKLDQGDLALEKV